MTVGVHLEPTILGYEEVVQYEEAVKWAGFGPPAGGSAGACKLTIMAIYDCSHEYDYDNDGSQEYEYDDDRSD